MSDRYNIIVHREPNGDHPMNQRYYETVLHGTNILEFMRKHYDLDQYVVKLIHSNDDQDFDYHMNYAQLGESAAFTGTIIPIGTSVACTILYLFKKEEEGQ